jgi:4'-phosphopantetheinyl transferase
MTPFPPSADTVELWALTLDLPAGEWAPWTALLEKSERARADRLPPASRRRYVISRTAVRGILGGYLGVAPREIRWRIVGHGKPTVAGIRHNLSHTGDRALLAVTARRPVGVDIEAGRLLRDPCAMATRFFPSADAAAVRDAGSPWQQRRQYLRLWTRKEACAKAAGSRLAAGLRLATGDAPETVVEDPRLGPSTCWWVRDLPVGAPLAAAVAVEGATRCALLPRRSDHAWSIPLG